MGLLSNLLNDNSGKKAAGSVSDMEKALASDRWITIHPHGFLQGEGEDETKQYYRRIFIDDDGNIEKGIGKGHNIKDLSKALGVNLQIPRSQIHSENVSCHSVLPSA